MDSGGNMEISPKLKIGQEINNESNEVCEVDMPEADRNCSANDKLFNIDCVQQHLTTKLMGRNIVHKETTGTTMDDAAERAVLGAKFNDSSNILRHQRSRPALFPSS